MLRHLPALALGLVLACASPTLPLPPPAIPAQQAVDADHISLTSSECGSVPGGSTVQVLNWGGSTIAVPATEFGRVALANACGAWSLQQIFAHDNDRLTITYQVGTDVSLPQTVFVKVP